MNQALHNIQHLCSPMAKILMNTYCEAISSFVDARTILSQEGTSQGDPLAMPMHASAITLLIKAIQNNKTGVVCR